MATHHCCRFRNSGDRWRLQEVWRRVLNVADLYDEVVDGHVAAVERGVGPRVLEEKVQHDNEISAPICRNKNRILVN